MWRVFFFLFHFGEPANSFEDKCPLKSRQCYLSINFIENDYFHWSWDTTKCFLVREQIASPHAASHFSIIQQTARKTKLKVMIIYNGTNKRQFVYQLKTENINWNLKNAIFAEMKVVCIILINARNISHFFFVESL